MDPILVATDLSPLSERALRRGIQLAGALGVDCHVVAAVDDALPEDIATDLQARVGENLARLVQSCGGATSVEALKGDPLETIPRHATALGAGLLVLGLHRPRRFLDDLRETTMERLVRCSPLPVLLVARPVDHDYRSVLAPVGFSPACARAVRAAMTLAPAARVDAFHALHIPYAGFTGDGPTSPAGHALTAEAEALAAAWKAASGLEESGLTPVVEAGDLSALLESRLARGNHDVVAIGAHTRSVPLAGRLGGFAAGLIRRPPTDLLVAR